MRKPMLVLMLAAALELAACGSDPLEIDSEKGEPSTTAEAGTTEGSARDETETRAKPAKRRLIYLDARTLCGQFGVREVVRRFGLDPGSAADVALAYAEQNYSGPFRGAGYRGCLSGFRR